MANEKKSEVQLLKEVEEARSLVKIGGFYAHYKHPGEKRYQVIDVAIDEETESVRVIYKSLQMGALWIRTIDNFTGEVEVGEQKVPRFKLIQ